MNNEINTGQVKIIEEGEKYYAISPDVMIRRMLEREELFIFNPDTAETLGAEDIYNVSMNGDAVQITLSSKDKNSNFHGSLTQPTGVYKNPFNCPFGCEPRREAK